MFSLPGSKNNHKTSPYYLCFVRGTATEYMIKSCVKFPHKIIFHNITAYGSK